MSHREALEFFGLVAAANLDRLSEASVCEIGSYDVNGSIRRCFLGAKAHIGIDVVAGPGVDVVSLGHEFNAPDGQFDLVVSAECLEHDPHWRSTVTNMVRLTRPGGVVAISCASTGRVEHGTRRTRMQDSPGSAVLADHYKNISYSELTSLVSSIGKFEKTLLVNNRFSCDLYFAGIVGAESPVDRQMEIPSIEAVRNIAKGTRWHEHARRVPNYLLRLLPLSEERYQDLSVGVGSKIQSMSALRSK